MASLDWRHSRHWAKKPAPCGICDKPTNLRSDLGKPVHKVCAEEWIDKHPQPADRP
ncbi:hypothetical protein OH807_22710 [Kitasatospora sp. NBC_01560]|uniref:hypothetical protein n=1 Tax=Kitasatospora sp. NBC_01560 TaxID=2975965 RepID=UPI00386EA183